MGLILKYLEICLKTEQESKGQGSRPPYDYILMFKILILQRYYNLSDDQVEYQVVFSKECQLRQSRN
jgi:hypothetical protein